MALHSALLTALLTSSLALVAGAGSVPAAEAAATKPVVSKVSPNVGPSKRPPRVTITGKGLAGATKVMFGHKPGKRIRLVSNRKLTVRPPWHRPGRVQVRVKTIDGGWSKVVGRYTYVAESGEATGITRLSDGL